MQNDDRGGRARRFAAYLADLASVLGDPRRYTAMINYCTGLLLPSERKSVEPIAAVTAPTRTAAQHQSLLHFVGQGDWSDKAVLERIRAYTIPHIETHGAVSAWIVDDTSFPKKGTHSVGVARQYCGQLGKQENCQVAVSLSIANDHASLPVAYQLYLPQSWASDYARRKKAGVPEDVEFKDIHRSRSSRSHGLARRVCLAASFSSTPDMASRQTSGTSSALSNSSMSLA
jgi:SRSO17 transposase